MGTQVTPHWKSENSGILAQKKGKRSVRQEGDGGPSSNWLEQDSKHKTNWWHAYRHDKESTCTQI